ncbi:MAG TPA: SCO family protein [Polyangia bacterium]|jgi:protein SCO1/2
MNVTSTGGRSLLTLLIGAASVLGCARRPESREPRPALRPPPAVAQVDIEEHLGRKLPASLTFVDQDGRSVRIGDLFSDGRPVVMVLAYFRCPMLCDLVQQGVATALRASSLRGGRDVRMVTVSIDPQDTLGNARLRRTGLLQAMGVAGGAPSDPWRVLIGAEPEIRALADTLGFRFAYDPGSRQYAHPACAFVLTPDGRVSRYLYGTTFRPFDMRLAVVEAGQDRVGTIVDRVLLTCFRYDPSARKYGVYVLGVMRGGSLVVLLAFGVALALMVRRGRRRAGWPSKGPP